MTNKTTRDLVERLEGPLRDFLDAEEVRLQKELDYLKRVHRGISEGSALELPSTTLSDIFLLDSLNQYFPG